MLKENKQEHSLGNNKRNKTNTSQARAAKWPKLQRQTGHNKSPRNKNRVEEEPSDEDRDLQEKEQTNRTVLEDGEIDNGKSRKNDGAPTERSGKIKKHVDKLRIIIH